MTVSPTPPIKDVTSLTQQQAALTLRQNDHDRKPNSSYQGCHISYTTTSSTDTQTERS